MAFDRPAAAEDFKPLDKWLFFLKHASHLEDPPQVLPRSTFQQLLEGADIASFSAEEQNAYEESLKYYRDLINITHTARLEGRRASVIINTVIRQIKKRFGELSEERAIAIKALPLSSLEVLSEALLDFTSLQDLDAWLEKQSE